MMAGQPNLSQLLKRIVDASPNNVHEDNLLALCKSVATDLRFRKIPANRVAEVVRQMSRQPITDVPASVEQAYRGVMVPPDFMKKLIGAEDLVSSERAAEAADAAKVQGLRSLKDAPIIAVNATHVADKKVSWVKSTAQKIEMLPTEQKMHAGIWYIGAAMSALGGVSAARHAITRDENGARHVQWTQAGVALLQACLAIGCAHLGTQALRTSAVR